MILLRNMKYVLLKSVKVGYLKVVLFILNIVNMSNIAYMSEVKAVHSSHIFTNKTKIKGQQGRTTIIK